MTRHSEEHSTRRKRSERCASAKCGRAFREGAQIILLMLAVVGGATTGTLLRLYTHAYSQPELHPREMMYLYFPAELFIRFISFITVPFLVSSLISGIGKNIHKLSTTYSTRHC